MSTQDKYIFEAEDRAMSITISLFYIVVVLAGILTIYVISQNIFAGMAMVIAVTMFAVQANSALYDYHKARIELIAFKRQVRDLYIYSRSNDDETVVSRKDYAINMLKQAGNKNGVKIHALIKGDTLIRVYSLKDNGDVNESRIYRPVDSFPATQSYWEFLRFVEEYIKQNETSRINVERRQGQYLDNWIDKNYFAQN